MISPKRFQGSSLYTYFVRYRWLWFPRTTDLSSSRLWFSHYAVENGRFRRNSVCYGPVYGSGLCLRYGYGPVNNSRLSLLVGFGPVCTQQHLSSPTATSPMTSTLGMPSPLRTNSSIFRHAPSPQQPPLVPIRILDALAASFLMRRNDGVVRLNLW